MTYQMIEDYTLDFTGGPMIPKGWAIHWWGDPAQNPTFAGILNVLRTRSAQRSASVNFMAESGKVACLVSPFIVAWGQGDGTYGWGNNNLVSVECNPRCTAEDRETVAELIADQYIQNGIPITLYPHNDFNATQCPGVWEQWIPWLTKRANEIVAEKTINLASTGDTEMASFHAAEDWYAAMIGAQAAIHARTNYIKGKDSPDIYDVTGGVPRKLELPEWNILVAAGHHAAETDQSNIDAFLADYKARNGS